MPMQYDMRYTYVCILYPLSVYTLSALALRRHMECFDWLGAGCGYSQSALLVLALPCHFQGQCLTGRAHTNITGRRVPAHVQEAPLAMVPESTPLAAVALLIATLSTFNCSLRSRLVSTVMLSASPAVGRDLYWACRPCLAHISPRFDRGLAPSLGLHLPTARRPVVHAGLPQSAVGMRLWVSRPCLARINPRFDRGFAPSLGLHLPTVSRPVVLSTQGYRRVRLACVCGSRGARLSLQLEWHVCDGCVDK